VKRAQAISALKKNEAAIRNLGARALFLYGSTARDQAESDSDLDIFIEFEEGSKFSLMELVGIKFLLEDNIGTSVDVATRDGLHPRLKRRIEAEAVQVF
jgi:uncharacterized protein